jgi:hypothetical protein
METFIDLGTTVESCYVRDMTPAEWYGVMVRSKFDGRNQSIIIHPDWAFPSQINIDIDNEPVGEQRQ